MAISTDNKTVTASKTRLWVVCCEETAATQQLSDAITKWQLPGVRSLFTESLLTHQTPTGQPLSETVSASDYAIFVTPYNQPCAQVQISPLDVTTPNTEDLSSPAALLSAIHNRHGQSPQSWWLKVPTTKLRAHQMQPVPAQESAAQALDQIGVFIRNYQLATLRGGGNAMAKPFPEKIAPKAINNDAKQPLNKTDSTTETSPKKQVVLSHYRRI